MSAAMEKVINDLEKFRGKIPALEISKQEFQEWCNHMDRARIALSRRVRDKPIVRSTG